MNETDEVPLAVEVGAANAKGRSLILVRRNAETLHCDTITLASARARRSFLKALGSQVPGLSDDEHVRIEQELVRLASEVAQSGQTHLAPAARTRADLVAARDAAAEAALKSMPKAVISAGEAMLEDSRLVQRIQDDFDALEVVGEHHVRLATYVVGTSRLLDRPLSALVQGPTSSGKSHVLAKAMALMPPEALLMSTDLTPNALYYIEEGALVHRAVVVGERSRRDKDVQAEATRALREMISSHRLTKTVTVKSASGGMRTETIVRHGPIAFMETTSLTRIFEEDANRALSLATDETAEQTRRVLDHLAVRATRGRVDTGEIVLRHHALQRLLRRVGVRIPYLHAILSQMPAERPEARRAGGHLVGAISAIALLHQRQRVAGDVALEHDMVIDAQIADYAIARDMLLGPFGQLLGCELSPAVANFGKRLVERGLAPGFTAAQAAEGDSVIASPEVCRRYLRELNDAQVVEIVEGGTGGKPNMYSIVGKVPEPGAIWLPTVEALQATCVSVFMPDGGAAGGQARQADERRRTADPSPSASTICQPVPPVRLGAPVGQVDGEPAGERSRSTSRTVAHQDDWWPANGDFGADEVPLELLDGAENQKYRTYPADHNIGPEVYDDGPDRMTAGP